MFFATWGIVLKSVALIVHIRKLFKVFTEELNYFLIIVKLQLCFVSDIVCKVFYIKISIQFYCQLYIWWDDIHVQNVDDAGC